MQSTRETNPPSGIHLEPWLRVVWVVAFIFLSIVIAYLVFTNVQKFVVGWTMTDLPGLAIKPQETPGIATTAVVNKGGNLPPLVLPGVTPQPWDGASRVNMLVMGLDYRDWEIGEGAPRTDTMILLSLDPLSMTAGILSIPRDLWVNIPGFEPNRINVAYRFGEIYAMPGGGPALAMQTVEQLLGLKIDYYALIDFYAFARFIDELGGVRVVVPDRIKVDPLGDRPPLFIKSGVQVLSGELALAYARARNTKGGDFDRAKRQQQVIMGIRAHFVNPENLVKLIQKTPILYEELSAGVKTNLSLDQAFQLAWLARQISEENIKRGIIGTDHITLAKSPDGSDVLKPRPEAIRLLRDEIFTTSSPLSPAASAEITELVLGEAATVSVLNGASSPGLATRTLEYLNSLGVMVVATGDAPEIYTYTSLIDYTGNPYTVRFLMETMSLSPERIYHRFDPTSQVGIVLLLGYDWANNNPMP